jgi:2-amino-4-hydroxy-6-hydroxymethyldihydropteridine diphosphokinase
MSIAFISIGTNLGNKPKNLNQAIHAIERTCGILKQKSSIYETTAWGFASFNNFLNQVVSVDTNLSPQNLLAKLLTIETNMGRERNTVHYEDRIIDLDIISFDDLILESQNLTIPHPQYHKRAFVVWPLAEIAPHHWHSLQQKTAFQLKQDLANQTEIKLFEA